MTIPAHLLPRPPMLLDAATVGAFERLYAKHVERGQGETVPYDLAAPRWQFLCYLADTKPVVLHGTGDADIAEFEPRQSNDTNEFGNRRAIYAARDGLWPMYFAIVDRGRYRMGLMNSCLRVTAPSDVTGSYYFFSVGGTAGKLPAAPWRSGTVYLLPDQTFEPQTMNQRDGFTVESTQVASLVVVRPLAKVSVVPADFPFLHQIRRHDPSAIRERAHANPDGFPWLDE